MNRHRSQSVGVNARTAAGKAINVATGNTITINSLLEKICKIKEQTCTAERLAARQGDIRHSRADISMAGMELGWTPIVDFETGLRKLLGS